MPANHKATQRLLRECRCFMGKDPQGNFQFYMQPGLSGPSFRMAMWDERDGPVPHERGSDEPKPPACDGTVGSA
jgi:hypothetical protein